MSKNAADGRSAIWGHYEHVFGSTVRRAEFRRGSTRIEVGKWDLTNSDAGVVVYGTVGASSARGVSSAPEVVVAVNPQVDAIVEALASLAVTPELPRIKEGSTVWFPDPLWPGTQMNSFVMQTEHLPIQALTLAGGNHVHFVGAIPIFEFERRLCEDRGIRGLFEYWKSGQVVFWDPRRTPTSAT